MAFIRWFLITFRGKFPLEEFEVGITYVKLNLKNGDVLKPIFEYRGYVDDFYLVEKRRSVIRSESLAKYDIESQCEKGLIGITETEYVSSTEISTVEYVTEKFIKKHGI